MQDDLKLVSDLLEEYGRSIGISGLALDAAGKCSLLFDDKLNVTLELDHEARTLIGFAEVGAIPESGAELCYQKLLEANYFWQHTGGLGTLAVSPSRDPNHRPVVMILFQAPVIGLDIGSFHNQFEVFIDTAEAWMDYLINFEKHTDSESGDGPEFDFKGPAIRV